ncbi:MAG: hypothetical protein Q8L81_07570 [Bacteroidota bacterium]|nr:hypothetical protein [Bacteroidota bacterium]
MNEIGKQIEIFTQVYFKGYLDEVKSLDFEKDEHHFLFGLLDKTVENFSAVGHLLQIMSQEHNHYLKNSLYLLLRGCLSDVIMINWLMWETEEDKNADESLKIKTYEIERDHIKFHLMYLQKFESLGLLPKKEKEEELQILNDLFGDLLPEVQRDLNTKGFKTVSIRDMLNLHTKNNLALISAYKGYFMFSKMEHSGAFTHMIRQQSYKKDNPMDQHINTAIFDITTAIQALVPIFFKDDDFLGKIKSFKII